MRAALRYINFGALCLGFLKVSQLFAEHREDDSANDYDASIDTIEALMTFLTYGLFLSFGGVAIKKAVVKARNVDKTKLVEKIRNIRSNTAAEAETIRSTAAEAETTGAGSSDFSEGESFDGSNPMHSGGRAAAASEVSEGRDIAVEMTTFRSSKATRLVEHGLQLSVESSETMALPAPAAAAPVATASDLLAGWTTHNTPGGDTYYCNRATGVTSWTLPA